MSEILYDISGIAQQLQTSATTPFFMTLSFNGSAPINPALYQQPVALDSFSLLVNGQLYTAAAGEFWGNYTEGTAFEGGLLIVQPGFDMAWNYQTVAPTAHDLGDALLQEPYYANDGGLNGEWYFQSMTIHVVDPPVNVPAPWGWVGIVLFCIILCAMLAFSGPGSEP